MPNNLPINAVTPSNLPINLNMSNSPFTVTIQAGQPMGLLLAITYPVTFTEIYP